MKKNLDSIPLQTCKVEAGFPSPADNYIEKKLNLNQYLIKNPEATFLVRATGESMIDSGIFSGDILIVDKSLEVSNNSIVIASIDGDLTVKRFVKGNGLKSSYLVSENSEYPSIELKNDCDLEIWGVVTHSIHQLR